ncbi:MAG: BtpA/SgcQ family protein [Ignavibacteria bacterium]|nr:BtpA/SgcQ family protein [Ignavibacteria bacterium]
MTAQRFPFRLIGMIHLLPLPGAPRFRGSRDEILDRALADAEALAEAGFDALLVENYGDAPFHKERAEPFVVAEMTRIAVALRQSCALPLGVQVLRNAAAASLSIAAASGAAFIRVNVHTGAMLTDQGVIEGRADETVRLRALLRSDVRIFADVLVKHGIPLASMPVADAARDAVHRGLADGVIISGPSTGAATDPADVKAAREAVDAPILVGSGASAASAALLLRQAHGLIVGTAIKRGGRTTAPVDPARAARFVLAANG